MAQRLVGLQHASFARHQHHADRRVGERAVEAPFARLQRRDVPRRLGCRAVVRFDLAKEQVDRRQEHRDDRRDHDQDAAAEDAVRGVHQAGDRRAPCERQRKPRMVAQHRDRAHRLTLLQREQRGHQQRAAREVRERREEQHAERDAGARGGRRAGADHQRERAAATVDRERRHRGTAEATRQALRRPIRADCRLRRRGERCSTRTVEQQQQEHEDLGTRDRRLPARDAHREEARHRGKRRSRKHLQHRVGGEPRDLDDGQAQHDRAEHERGPPVELRLRGVIVHGEHRRAPRTWPQLRLRDAPSTARRAGSCRRR